MATQPNTQLLHLIGFIIWGDFGPLTMYKSKRGKMVAFAKTWPEKPPSWQQERQRQRLRWAARRWSALDDQTRKKWENACKRGSLPMTGYNLFVHWCLTKDESYIRTIELQTGISLI